MPDTDLKALYAAVGRAISEWETLEAHLSYTYSIFEGRPVDSALLRDYGREARIFRTRMEAVRASAEKYFQSHPNQEQEARFEALVSKAEELSTLRNRIAHGMVMGQQASPGQTLYSLIPPSHGFHHLTKKDGGESYSYDSKEIEAHTDSFIKLATDVQKFNHERHPPYGARNP
ncbi:hypothetical protein [Bradyrhizobium septentrionale]